MKAAIIEALLARAAHGSVEEYWRLVRLLDRAKE